MPGSQRFVPSGDALGGHGQGPGQRGRSESVSMPGGLDCCWRWHHDGHILISVLSGTGDVIFLHWFFLVLNPH